MEVHTESHPEYFLLRIAGDMRLWNRANVEAQLRDKLGEVLENESLRRILLNLRGVTLLDSLGIAALARVPISCLRRNIDMKIVMPPGVPGEALKQLGIFWAWQVFEDEPAALQACLAASEASG